MTSAWFRSGIENAFSQYSSVKPSLIANVSRSRFADASTNEKTAITAIGTST